MGESANGDGYGADAVVEHFAEHDPHDGAPGGGEECDVEVRGYECDGAGGSQIPVVGACPHAEADAEGGEGECHAYASGEQKRFAADFIDEEDGDDGHGEVDAAAEQAEKEGVAFFEADALPEHGAVVEDDVDAH